MKMINGFMFCRFLGLTLILFLTILSCTKQIEDDNYPTFDYLLVKKKLDTLNVKMNKEGYFPTVSVHTNGKKIITFFGASHVGDTAHPQFEALITSFKGANPQIAFNEGGQVADSIHYKSKEEAVAGKGETGVLKMLCDEKGIEMNNGDMTAKEEFKQLLAQYPRDQVFIYLAIERFLNPYHQGFLGDGSIESLFFSDFVNYLEKNDFKLIEKEKKYTYVQETYLKYFKKPLVLNKLEPVHDYYLLNTGTFGNLGCSSKQIRDQILLQKIDNVLKTNDRVFVVFGGSHWVAVQPALDFIIQKHK